MSPSQAGSIARVADGMELDAFKPALPNVGVNGLAMSAARFANVCDVLRSQARKAEAQCSGVCSGVRGVRLPHCISLQMTTEAAVASVLSAKVTAIVTHILGSLRSMPVSALGAGVLVMITPPSQAPANTVQ